ncbi:hypothetical protein BJX64DRAFT_143036 [Aspergillus heterothallicus]
MGLSPLRMALSFRLNQGLMRVKRPELQNSAHPRARAKAQQTRMIGTKTKATTIIAVFCLGFMAVPIQWNPILPCRDTIGIGSDSSIDSQRYDSVVGEAASAFSCCWTVLALSGNTSRK